MSQQPTSSSPKQSVSIIILTGQSGSGKSTAIRALEDCGYFCVDNLPTALVKSLVETVIKQQLASKLALVMDMRDQALLQNTGSLIADLRAADFPTRLIFLEADEGAVLRRYSQTRRLHPLDTGMGLPGAILHEQSLLAPLRALADEIIDTSSLSPHSLRKRMVDSFSTEEQDRAMRVTVQSFGFKYGLPAEADMVLDVRFLPNPFFEQTLRPQTGLDEPVSAYVLSQNATSEFRRYTEAFLAFLLPHYQAEGKRYFTLAIGCTGGRHRSVALAEALGKTLAERGFSADIRHRDVTRDSLARGPAC